MFRKNLSQKKISDLSCVSTSTVSRFCQGESIGSFFLQKILHVCDDLSLEWLFYGSGEMFRSREGGVVNNYGAFAGSDFISDGGVQVKNSTGVTVGKPVRQDVDALLREKDALILEKDRVISERDNTIRELLLRIK